MGKFTKKKCDKLGAKDRRYLKISFDFSDTPDEKAIEKERYHAHFDSHLCYRRRPPARGCGT